MKRMLQKLFKSNPATPDAPASVIVVSGLPRSGTSMMMKMLEAGGLSVVVDHQREADTDNPKGYYEFERVKQLDKGDRAWVADAQGKVVKVIAALLEYLPPDQSYKVFFMQRRMEEVLASQQKMLANRSESTNSISDEEMADLFQKHVQKVKAWVSAQSNFELLEIDYNLMLADPEPYASQVNQFLGGHLDETAMVEVVDPDLYRNRV